ncbi:toll/interleukin-1 receptor-like protein [Rosa sericea]
MGSALKKSVYVVLSFFLLCKSIFPKVWKIRLAKLLVVIYFVYVGSRFFGITFKCTKTQPWKYDVFLSFTGETRKGFTHFLYKALQRRGLKVFRDQEIQRGASISSMLSTGIEESRFAIIILSPKYASSTWCLDELTKIVECMEVKGTTILPIFYKVKPTSVRNQRGAFAKAFKKHDNNYVKDKAKVQRWRSAFTKLSGIAGWISTEWYEYELIEEVVELVCSTCILARSK